MREALVRVFLHGALGDEFGPEHAFAIRSPREAVAALAANYPDFRQAFLRYARYALFVDGDWRDMEDAPVLPVSREVHFIPIVEGQGPLIAPLILAAVPALGTIGANIVAGIIVTALMWGISQLFFKPEEAKAGDDKSESYIFSGAENTTLQGSAVPVIYGRCFVGSVVVSAGLSVGDQQINSSSGRSAVAAERGDYPQSPIDPRALSNRGVPEQPAIELLEVAPGRFRLGPVGWRHVGVVALLEQDGNREVDLFMPPEAGMPYRWDYWRGFERYQPGETGLLGN